MAIDRPEVIDGAPRRGWTAKEGFLVPRGMTAQPAGEESLTRLLRHRRSRRSRPSARSGHWRGRLERSRHGQKPEKWRPSRTGKPAAWQASAASSPSTGIAPASPANATGNAASFGARTDALPVLPQALPRGLLFGTEVDQHQPLHPQPRRLRGYALSGAVLVRRSDVDRDHARARSRLDGLGVAASPATRTKAVIPTATAPKIENAICHASDGIRCFTMPWVA